MTNESTPSRSGNADVLPFERLLRIARGLVESEEDKVRINDKRFVLSGGELVEEPPTRR
jgi:hypothetical protein